MSFLKDPMLKTFKDMLVKGPRGYANEKLAGSLPKAEEVMNLDRSNPEALRAYMQQHAAQSSAVMESYFGKRTISAENRAGLEHVMSQAIDNQAAMYEMLQKHKQESAAKAAADEGSADTPSPEDKK